MAPKTSSFDNIRTRHIRISCLTDPDRRNALSEEMLAVLADAFDQASDNPDSAGNHSGCRWSCFLLEAADLKQMSAARQRC